MIKTAPEQVAQGVTYVAGATAVVGGLSYEIWLGIGGLTIAVISATISAYYKHKHYKLAVENSKK